MKRWIVGIMTGLLASVGLIARHFKHRSEQLQAEAEERDVREKAHVARMQERVAAVQREHERMKAPDPKRRTDFE